MQQEKAKKYFMVDMTPDSVTFWLPKNIWRWIMDGESLDNTQIKVDDRKDGNKLYLVDC